MENAQHHAANKLDGSKTQSNLSRAFDDKSRSSAIYKLYAKKAHEDGLHDSERMFNEMSENHLNHASLWYGYMDGISDTQSNISNASALQSDLYDSYTDMAKLADDEGFNEIAEKMRLMQKVENTHKNMLSDMAQKLENGIQQADANTHWVCCSCGFDTYGNHAPERCPLCSYPAQYFEMAN